MAPPDPSACPACPACDRLARLRRGEDPELLAELSESFVVLGDCQRWPGWCTLFLKDHHEHLGDLPLARQTRLFEDVATVAAAIRAVLAPSRLNYECLGNVVAHVHWHVIPRYAGGANVGGKGGEPQPHDTVWVRPAAELADRGDPALRADLVRRLRAALSGPVRTV